MKANDVLQRIKSNLDDNHPEGVDQAYLDGYFRRNGETLVQMIQEILGEWLEPAEASALAPPTFDTMPDEWTSSKRITANLSAMRVLGKRQLVELKDADRRVLSGYSGWGGLSIKKALPKMPSGVPQPEVRGLIHEYYTPTKVVREVARVIAPLVPYLPRHDGKLIALEPSAGIGRFINALSGPNYSDYLRWKAVEWSELSATMLAGTRPDVEVCNAPFEAWVQDYAPMYDQHVGLVLSNPPYGQRGRAWTKDGNVAYRKGAMKKQAYAYFLRRAMDLVGEGGLGVFILPYGFMSGKTATLRALREQVLLRHHLSCAYRLPSKLFPGANIVVDLVFLRSRGGEIMEVAEEDKAILAGEYFELFRHHILGTEKDKPRSETDVTKRSWYQVIGDFTELPDLVEREYCAACSMRHLSKPGEQTKATGYAVSRTIGRQIDADLSDVYPEHIKQAHTIGLRVDTYMAKLAADETKWCHDAWKELFEALTIWNDGRRNPWKDKALVSASRTSIALQRFLTSYTKQGSISKALTSQPDVVATFQCHPDREIVALADYLYRKEKQLDLHDLVFASRRMGGTLKPAKIQRLLMAAGWCLELSDKRKNKTSLLVGLVPPDEFYTGHLWLAYDRMISVPKTDKHYDIAQNQAAELMRRIEPKLLEEIENIEPRQTWIPLGLVNDWWVYHTDGRQGRLVYYDGLYQVASIDMANIRNRLDKDAYYLLGWLNHDYNLFRPGKSKHFITERDEHGRVKRDYAGRAIKKRVELTTDDLRIRMSKIWTAGFRGWLSSDEDRKVLLESAYNRRFKGWVLPGYSSEPLNLTRWTTTGKIPWPYQANAARRIIANRGGLLAFDVGVGKTITAAAVIAHGRQNGWCKRPVVVVPASIIFKWVGDFLDVLPDYRVGVIGATRYKATRGKLKGQWTSKTDSPAERGHKWTLFQAGHYDVMILSYDAMKRTQMNLRVLKNYAKSTEAIKRRVAMAKRNAEETKERRRTERQNAILKEGVDAWIEEMTELPKGWQYDPGVAWDDLGIDLLVVDEAQNFKNLYLPEPREGGVPKFMGNPGMGAKIAWQMDFRSHVVRKNRGRGGVLLLSATPAKNSPLEFYNLIQYVDHEAWTEVGIDNPEAFISRYLDIKQMPNFGADMQMRMTFGVAGFRNLDELRSVIFRYGDFKTADDVGLHLPDAEVNLVEVDMNSEQEDLYKSLVREIETAIKSMRGGDASHKDRGKILGIMAQLGLIAIHPSLYTAKGSDRVTWDTADEFTGECPKITELVSRVKGRDDCGHIVFADNVAVHKWVRSELVKAGVQANRIAILNAKSAKSADARQRIALGFTDTENPKYDVVVANNIAYEGMDLQRRTCAIHHLDFPWEPATLQQRNGRGVRQGNEWGAKHGNAIEINYYMSRKSMDGKKYHLIEKKRGWMIKLIKGQDRNTNNPGATVDLSPMDMLIMLSRDPEHTKALLAQQEADMRLEQNGKICSDAADTLRHVRARFRRSEFSRTTPQQAAHLKAEGESLLSGLESVPTDAWPWFHLATMAREREMYVTRPAGVPIYEGMKLSIGNLGKVDHIQVGAIRGTICGVRNAGDGSWRSVKLSEYDYQTIEIGMVEANTWGEGAELSPDHIHKILMNGIASLKGHTDWPELNWRMGDEEWKEIWWPKVEAEVRASLAGTMYVRGQAVPAMWNGDLVVVSGRDLNQVDSLIPPTQAGYRTFLTLAPNANLKFSELSRCGTYWWDYTIPRTLLSDARKTEVEKAA